MITKRHKYCRGWRNYNKTVSGCGYKSVRLSNSGQFDKAWSLSGISSECWCYSGSN